MNILFHCSEYPPFRHGGIGSVIRIVAEELASRGHNIYVSGYYSGLDKSESIEVINGVTILRYNYRPNLSSFQKKLRLYRNKARLLGNLIQEELDFYEDRIDELIVKFQIQVLELTDFYEFNVYRTTLKFRKFSVPTVIRVHGSESFMLYNSGKKYAHALKNDKAHFSRADYLCSVSNYSQDYVNKMMPDVLCKSKVVIYNPIENKFLKHNAPSNNKVILYIGKLIKTKGAYDVIKAFNHIVEKHPDWELHMLGTGSKEEAQTITTELSRNKIKFLGFCDRDKVAEEIDNCAFACIPTYFETFGMVPIEIMGRTRAVIFTERTSGKEIIDDGVDGYTVNPENVDEIFIKMQYLINDEKKRNIFADTGYNKVCKQFSAKSIVDILLYYYSNLHK